MEKNLQDAIKIVNDNKSTSLNETASQGGTENQTLYVYNEFEAKKAQKLNNNTIVVISGQNEQI